MAAVLIGPTYRWTVLTAADAFPVSTADGPIPVASTLTVLDSGATFTWDGSRWAADKTASAGRDDLGSRLAALAEIETAILHELIALRLGMIDAGACQQISPADLQTELATT